VAERLAYSTALSMASVPAVAVILARVAGTGVTLWVAIASVIIVFGSGLLAITVKGSAQAAADGPALPRPAMIRDSRVAVLIAAGLVLALIAVVVTSAPGWLLVLTAAGLVLAGVLMARQPAESQGRESPGVDSPGVDSPAGDSPGSAGESPLPGAVRTAAMTIVLALTAFRAYVGVVRHDWPHIRGGDMFSHAVMTEQMLSHGSYGSYLVYPPGFSALSAVVCRLSVLSPLALFPVLAPALLVITALGAYALATRLWGWEYGVVAAALSGLVLTGSYGSFSDGRYPDLVAAYFLIIMTVAALVGFQQTLSLRSGLLLAVVAGSVVFYHSIAALYVAVLLALVTVAGLPYLLLRRQRAEAGRLLLALASIAVLSGCYALYTYGLPSFLGGQSSTGTAVTITLGSQPVPPAGHLLTELAPAIVWLGALSVAMMAASIRYLRTPSQVLATVTVIAWCVFMYAGSRTAADGFPQRFERDLGGPLAVVGALGAGVILLSLWHGRREARAAVVLACAAAVGALGLSVTVQAVTDLRTAAEPARDVLTPQVAAAGAWLAVHSSGAGNIISTPYLNPGISNRAVLAMGGYTGLQSYKPRRISHPRSLPTAGRQPLLDSREVLTHPDGCPAAGILIKDDVRYVVLSKQGGDADLAAFRSDSARYRQVFDNPSVIIYVPGHEPCG
jgi:hypothetical protein